MPLLAWAEAPEDALARYRAAADAQMARAEAIAAEVLRNPPLISQQASSTQNPHHPPAAALLPIPARTPIWTPNAVRAALARRQGAPLSAQGGPMPAPSRGAPTQDAHTAAAAAAGGAFSGAPTARVIAEARDAPGNDAAGATAAVHSAVPMQGWLSPFRLTPGQFGAPRPPSPPHHQHESTFLYELEPDSEHEAGESVEEDQDEGGQAASMDWQANEAPPGAQRAGTPMPRRGSYEHVPGDPDDMVPLRSPWSPRTPGMVLHTHPWRYDQQHGMQGTTPSFSPPTPLPPPKQKHPLPCIVLVQLHDVLVQVHESCSNVRQVCSFIRGARYTILPQSSDNPPAPLVRLAWLCACTPSTMTSSLA